MHFRHNVLCEMLGMGINMEVKEVLNIALLSGEILLTK